MRTIKVVKPFLSYSVLVGDLACVLIKGEAFERGQRRDHVFTDSFCLPLGLRSDLAADRKVGVMPGEDFLHKLKTDEFFSKKQREDLSGEEFLERSSWKREMLQKCISGAVYPSVART